MHFPDFLTSEGRAKVRLASGEAQRLDRKENVAGLSKEDKQKRAEHLATILRHRGDTRKAIGLAGIGALAIGAAIHFRNADDTYAPTNSARQEVPASDRLQQRVLSREEAEHQVDQLIPRVEQGMAQLRSRVQNKLSQWGGHLPAPYLSADAFWAPFEVVEINKRNPTRNYEHFQRLRNGRIGDLNWFFYNTLRHSEHDNPEYGNIENYMAAAFSPPFREIRISPEFDPNKLMDLLVAYHELRHAVNDSNVRTGLNSREQYEAYMNFRRGRQGERQRFLIEDEAGAFAYEIEVLNVLLDDMLRQRSGNIDVTLAAEQLAVSDQHGKSILRMLIEFAQVYYPHGMTGGMFNTAFPRLVIQNYEAIGYDAYSTRPDGSIVRMHQ